MAEDVKKSDLVAREEAILEFWNNEHIFEKSLAKPSPKGEYVFYDGPPFATGLPHYGHLLQSAMKDVIPRYKTMCGYRVPRQWGWDCHGLPIENIVEKEIGSRSKKDIVSMGVKQFNDKCREQIFTYMHEWERIIPRFGRWADMKNPYRTMDMSYMESEWWAFKTLYEKGLAYEDYRSMHICPRCETTLSQGEVAEGYKDIKDLSVTVKFKIKNPERLSLSEDAEVYMLAWTTTPWTLPGNVALAVGPDIDYVVVEKKDNGIGTLVRFIVAKECASTLFEGQEYTILKSMKGTELVGLEYEPLFDYYAKDATLKNRENGWRVYAADFITADSGTGIAHEAPTFGADDWALLKQVGLPFVQHVGLDGIMKPEVIDFPAMDLKPRAKGKLEEIREADLTVVKFLEKEGKVFSYAKYEHSYPHCWRCDTALLNYATSSWFIAVEKIKPTLLETARSINWSPEHIKEGRWGQWLAGARDWSISRQRFWANTIPVWRCDACKKDQVFGSAAELKAASGVAVTDLHKDVVDDITVPCTCGGTAHRIPDVLDTWFDSGSAPFATRQVNAEKAATGEGLIPADFIGEAQDQCRAWFYYMHVLSGALFSERAFKQVIVTGMVLAEDGKKMSKKLKNYPDPMEVMEQHGADAMRLYILSSPVLHAEDLNFSEKGLVDLSRKVLGRLANVYEFYALYRAFPHTPSATSTDILDRWILARLAQVHAEVTAGLEQYALDVASRPFAQFVDDLSTWYLRRSRDRIKDGDEGALSTLAFILRETAKVMAPFTPFFADWLWREMRDKNDEESVHLSSWSEGGTFSDAEQMILANMAEVRTIVSMTLEQRAILALPVRQPLASMTITSSGTALEESLLQIFADEVNVRLVNRIMVPEAPLSITLDTVITPELKREGEIRELLRAVQDMRKKMGLKPGQPATLRVAGDETFLSLVHDAFEQLKTTAFITTIDEKENDGAVMNIVGCGHIAILC